ncbi:MAG: methionine adenosyltransferase domain-containing protein [Candidatus Aenigmarchaeota archaeon]
MVVKRYTENVGRSQVDYLSDLVARACTVPYFEHGRNYRSDVHVKISNGELSIGGHVATPKKINYKGIARQIIDQSGYRRTGDIPKGLPSIRTSVDTQRVDEAERINIEHGVGDSGHGRGWATNETIQGVRKSTIIARELANGFDNIASDRRYGKLGPDLKVNCVFDYSDSGEFIGLSSATIAIQHRKNVTHKHVTDIVKTLTHTALAVADIPHDSDRIKVNCAGKFVTGGPVADAGHSNARISYQTYGELDLLPFQESFWGRSPEKDSIVWPLWARHVARNIVTAGLADQCQVWYACDIGSTNVKEIGIRGLKPEADKDKVIDFVRDKFGYKVKDVIENLDLYNPGNYPPELITHGIFGSGLDLPWERTVLKKDDSDLLELWR